MSDAGAPRHDADGSRSRRLVPIYAVTGGRTRSVGREIPMESLVTMTERARWAGHRLENEYRTILELAHRPVALIEIGAALNVPVTVARDRKSVV